MSHREQSDPEETQDAPGVPEPTVRIAGADATGVIDDRVDATRNQMLSAHEVARDAPILENYAIERVLGRGGMSVVYQATQRSPRRSVALKVLRTAGAAGERELLRFRREASLVALLTHPYIVPIFEFGETEDGELFYTMPMVPGQPLDLYVATKKLSIRDTARLFVAICEGIEAAHRSGAIHRDIKPGNVMITDDGRPQVLDFGLAKLLPNQTALPSPEEDPHANDAFSASSSHASLEVSHAEEFVGTPAYMAPEQVDPKRTVDTRTDVYAIGLMLYRILTKGYPYELGDSINSALRAVLHAQPTSAQVYNDAIDRDLDAIMLKCLAKNPDARYQSANDLAEDLAAWLETRPVTARRNTALYRFSRFVRRNTAVSILAAVAFVALNVTVAVAFAKVTAERDVAEERRKDAETARVEEQAARRQAENAQLEVQRRMADSLAAQGNTQALLGDWAAARERYDRAMVEGGPGSRAAEQARWGLWHADRVAPMPLLRLDAHEGGALAATFSRDGRILATAGADGRVAIWNLPSGRRQALLGPFASGVFHLSMDTGGNRVAAADWDGAVRIWDLRRDEEIRLPELPAGPVLSLAMHGKGTYLAIAKDAGPIIRVNLDTGELRELAVPVPAMALTWRGDALASGLEDGSVCLLDIDGRQQWRSPGSAGAVSWLTGYGDDLLLVYDGGSPLRTLSVTTGEVVKSTIFQGEVAAVAAAGGDAWILRESGQLSSIDAAQETRAWLRRQPVSLAVNGALGVAAICRADGSVAIRDLAPEGGRSIVLTDADRAESVDLSEALGIVVTGSRDGVVRIWELRSGHLLAAYSDHQRGVTAVALAPDGSGVWSASLDRTVRWRAFDAATALTLKSPEEVATRLAVRPDGSLMAIYRNGAVCEGTLDSGALAPIPALSASNDRLVQLAHYGDQIVVVGEHGRLHGAVEKPAPGKSAVHDYAVWRNGAQEAFAQVGGQVLLRGIVNTTFIAHEDGVGALAFVDDGTLITGGRDGFVRFWRLRRDEIQLVGAYEQHANAISLLAVDGPWLISSGRDNRTCRSDLRLLEPPTFPIPTEKLPDWLASRNHWQSVAALQNAGHQPTDPINAALAAWITHHPTATNLIQNLPQSPTKTLLLKTK